MNSRTLLSERITERFVATTGHISEYDVYVGLGFDESAYENENGAGSLKEEWLTVDALDVGLAINLRPHTEAKGSR